ncbi:MAG: hypothetical protein A4S14_18250 [Proteobacteria bacterium SG_bin9]|nr:MAG: hypothetical protein A4S14_18250 [Proteobacteria bacterium SG_bin9]
MNPTVKTALLLVLGPALVAVLPTILLMIAVLWSMEFDVRDLPYYFVKTVVDIGPIPFYITYGLTFFFFGLKKLIAYSSR